jgi:hypothetical protein
LRIEVSAACQLVDIDFLLALRDLERFERRIVNIEVNTDGIQALAKQANLAAVATESANHRYSGAQMELPLGGLRESYDGARDALYKDVAMLINATKAMASNAQRQASVYDAQEASRRRGFM